MQTHSMELDIVYDAVFSLTMYRRLCIQETLQAAGLREEESIKSLDQRKNILRN